MLFGNVEFTLMSALVEGIHPTLAPNSGCYTTQTHILTSAHPISFPHLFLHPLAHVHTLCDSCTRVCVVHLLRQSGVFVNKHSIGLSVQVNRTYSQRFLLLVQFQLQGLILTSSHFTCSLKTPMNLRPDFTLTGRQVRHSCLRHGTSYQGKSATTGAEKNMLHF